MGENRIDVFGRGCWGPYITRNSNKIRYSQVAVVATPPAIHNTLGQSSFYTRAWHAYGQDF